MEVETPVNKFSESVILVVDDDATCLSVAAIILKKCNYQVVTVKNPMDALSTLQIKGGSFDLVVTDVHKPNMNCFELQPVISQVFDLPVLLMSTDEKGTRAILGKSAMKQGKQGKDNSVNFVLPTKTRMIWTESLHNIFLEAIRNIGLDKARPAKILDHMKVPGLTRENVSSHLQKYHISLQRATDASCRIQAPDINLAGRANHSTIASGTLGKYSQFHQENFGVQFSIPSSSTHTSIGYLTGNLQHLKNKGKEVDAVLDPVRNFSVFHNVNATEESQGIGDFSTSLMNQGNVQPQQKYRDSLQRVTDASCRIQAPDINLASRANQSTIASGTLGKYSQFHQENFGVQSSIHSSSNHTSTGYLTGNLQHLKNKGKEVVLDPVCNFSVFHNVNAMEESQGIGDFCTSLMNQGNVQPHQQNNEDETSVNSDGGFNQDMEKEDY